MEFEWDDGKAESNLRKHGVSFEDAIAIFDDPDAMTDPARHIGGEERFKTTGFVAAQVLVTVVHTNRPRGDEQVLRLISARPASRKERRDYGDRSIPEEAADR